MLSNTFICNKEEIAENSFKIFLGPGGKEGILVNIGGKLKAYVNSCPHMNGPTELEQCGDGACVLKCKWHGATFEPETGKALSAPAPEGSALRGLDVIIEDNKIYYQ
ncbi:MAG: Rieske (2Fe-2S) protein [bacterium]|nr:Rieske (2Fe-2S) protein [bacterium]